MDRVRVLEEKLWSKVPADVIEEAKRAAQTEPSWIAMQGNGHVVAMEPPGSPERRDGRRDLYRRGQPGHTYCEPIMWVSSSPSSPPPTL